MELFEPPNIFKLTDSIMVLNIKVMQAKFKGKKIIHQAGKDIYQRVHGSFIKTNSVLIHCAYLVLELKLSPITALQKFDGVPLKPYVRDVLSQRLLEVSIF
jgi:hypothetical protein